MAEDNLFQGLPPPSATPPSSNSQLQQQQQQQQQPRKSTAATNKDPSPVPPPALKSALKRSNPPQPTSEKAAAPGKRLRFKTMTDVSEKQILDAMQKIASHIKNLTKFAKASKLAIQLIQAGNVKPGTSDHFFAILEAAMSSPTACTDPSVRAEYHALFTAAQDIADLFGYKAAFSFSFQCHKFSKTAGRVKEAISNLPIATEDDDIEEAASLKDEIETADNDDPNKQDVSSVAQLEGNNKEDDDPFGLDALIPSKVKKDVMVRGKKDAASKNGNDEEEETKRFTKSQREGLIICLEIAAKRYKTPWCQTVIDILVKHAFDNVARFTSQQRDAIEKLWASIREQHIRRKQGKSVTGKLDVNAFEFLQTKYANEKISIRHSVGGSGDRRATQWLG
uniref:Uncharacterized protein n=1 Tax=Vitis vinifera TaxID=29760 RepID=A5B4W2_VITVI|nr:hypothetical protein VITISV_034274 [Vitis vinifera]